MLQQHNQAPASSQRPFSLYRITMEACGAIAALIFGLMSILVAGDVVLRNMHIEIISSSVELTEYMLMTATFIAAPWILYHGEHIRIDVLVNTLPRNAALLLDIICNILGFCVCAILTWQSIIVLTDLYSQETLVFKELVFPEWRLTLPLLIGSLLLSIEFLRRVYLSFHPSKH